MRLAYSIVIKLTTLLRHIAGWFFQLNLKIKDSNAIRNIPNEKSSVRRV